MLGVAKGATQVAATETHEDGRRTGVEAFALKGVEYFVDFIHGLRDMGLRDFGPFDKLRDSAVVEPVETPCQLIKILRGIVLNVGSLIVTRLPHISAVAVRNGVNNPFGQVLSRRIEVKDFIQVGVVNLAMNQTLDFSKVAHHAVVVQLLGATVHVDLPVVAMKVLALALIVEVELVAGGDL